ncbi:hypothetical protein G6F70_002295 [Rhizopus microsporus]|uniref:Uncharacterized protein n=1 Tax=Rhizopus azygosporus TaxID=86630 RepID=A0A367KFV4_RHIAZ|nr:hypothetical protein G6F71_006548 [Rhizopus microsporus]RCI01000.1 hypothetical protein CU097_005176 [Rhizopus azygosporus]KAG1202397.1 hypothetical protein G6F70_002295 [Rhizopus microsporus]KAG1211995.1 hypothetical protein G6F69_004100 [Rhizopus microsporus]KAG1233903.1 hypothetical protein G6F67_003936 [Rhizopus microsporus]
MTLEEEHYLSNTPVDVAIKALQTQVEQLKRIVNNKNTNEQNSNNSTSNEAEVQSLKKEIQELKTANDKAEYRIKMLLRALEERDNK